MCSVQVTLKPWHFPKKKSFQLLFLREEVRQDSIAADQWNCHMLRSDTAKMLQNKKQTPSPEMVKKCFVNVPPTED